MRETHRYSQQNFAVLLGVNVRTLQHWERGTWPPPIIGLRLLRELNKRPTWQARIRDREDVERVLIEVGLVENVRAA